MLRPDGPSHGQGCIAHRQPRSESSCEALHLLQICLQCRLSGQQEKKEKKPPRFLSFPASPRSAVVLHSKNAGVEIADLFASAGCNISGAMMLLLKSWPATALVICEFVTQSKVTKSP